MKVVERSSNHLRLSNAGSFWGKWGCVATIVAAILVIAFICAKEIRPTPYLGVAFGIFLLFMLVRELPRNFDRELWFNRPDNQLKVIKHPWIGRSQQTDYLLSNITNVRVVERKRPRPYRGWYPGCEDDIEASDPIKYATYDVELSFQSGETLIVYLGYKNKEATQLAMVISEFLGLTPNPASRLWYK